MNPVVVVTATILLMLGGSASGPAYQDPTDSGGVTGITNPIDVGHKGAKGAKGAKRCTYKGTVASVDATAKSFVVHPVKGEDVTLKVNDKTKYSPKGKGWDDVKADAKVSGTCKKDGADTWAASVAFAAEKKAKAAKPAAEKPAATTGR